jgi:hypothetical protein
MSTCRSFEEALQKRSDLVESGFYYKQLKRYFELFPQENILVLPYRWIKENPNRFLSSLYPFLGVDEGFTPPSAGKKEGATGEKVAEYRMPFLNPLIYKMRDWLHGGSIDEVLPRTGLKTWLRRLAKKNRRMVDAVEGDNISFPPMDPATYEKLFQVFEDDVRQLEKLLGWDLGHWRPGGQQVHSRTEHRQSG